MIVQSPWERLIAPESTFRLHPLRNTEVAHFYWCTDINTTEIWEAFDAPNASSLVDFAGPALFAGMPCERCGDIFAFSRKAAEAVPERAAIAVATIATAARATTPALASAQSAGEDAGYATSVLPTNSEIGGATFQRSPSLPAESKADAISAGGDILPVAPTTPKPLMSAVESALYLRPNCQKPGREDCGGHGKTHCHGCLKMTEQAA